METILFNAVIILYSLVSLFNLIRIGIVKKWIKNESVRNNNTIPNHQKLYLLIPLYNEQNIIKETYNHFFTLVSNYDNVHPVFITTSKEASNRTTQMLVEELMTSSPTNKILHIHYPYKKGVMAHQLNYAIDFLREKSSTDNFWIGVYNADSRIGTETLDYVLSKINNSDDNYCFQQYSWFKNPVTRNKSIVGSASLWQMRWSICFELYRTLYQLYLTKHFGNLANSVLLERMNYVIGHGFFISNNKLREINGFPQDSINEDAFLGLKINCKNIKICPIPYLEEADFASSTSIYIKQQTVWFNGPLYSFAYLKSIILLEKNITFKKACRYTTLAFKLFLHAIYWIAGPFCLFLIPIITMKNLMQLIIWITVVLIELPFTHFMVRKMILDLKIAHKNDVAKASIIYCIIFYLVHSIGPIRGLFLKMIGKNTQDDKYKTER